MAWRLKYLIAVSIFVFISAAQAEAALSKRTISLAFGKHRKSVVVEIAKSPQEHATGLMNRKKLNSDSGMLFVFETEQPREFWMKNTLIDLDIAYFDKNGKAVDIQQMQAQVSMMQANFPTYPSKSPAQFALEMNSGWFKKNGFLEGTKFDFVTGPSSK